MNINQMEMVNIDQLVSEKHTYRSLKKLLDFERIGSSVKMKIIWGLTAVVEW